MHESSLAAFVCTTGLEYFDKMPHMNASEFLVCALTKLYLRIHQILANHVNESGTLCVCGEFQHNTTILIYTFTTY